MTTPFHFGWPKFTVAAIISMIVVMLITAVETTGDVFATGEIVEKRIGRDDIAPGAARRRPRHHPRRRLQLLPLHLLRRERRASCASPASRAGTSSRPPALIMIVIGLMPKAGAVVAGIPHPVLGGAALAMFATVAVVGIQTLSRVDFNDHRNVVIVGTSVGLAMLVTVQPDVAQGRAGAGPRSSSAAASPWAASPRSC